MKRFCIFFTWTSFLILSELQYRVTNSCLHDVIGKTDENFIPDAGLPSNEEYRTGKVKRDVPKTNASLHGQPIRIQPIYFLSKHLLKEEKGALQNVLQRALSKIESLLSVINRVDGPLLLERKAACPVVLAKGINKGKCSRIQKGYVGEYCLDKFKIPSNHLKGLAIFNKTHRDPIKIYKSDGVGLKETDFVLYVTSKTTPQCNPYKSSALAYASACQLDRLGRPIAGQVNFCPRTLKAHKFDEELLYKTAIHELFHALGFSSKLFSRFVSCDGFGKCQPRDQPLVRTVSGVKRLVTPAVLREMKQHFDCHDEPDFGGPLQNKNGTLASHWDSILMHSSIMTAREQKPYLTLIDRITLAVFEDSGWYKVNYAQADPFIWGKGKGCQFGIKNACRDGLCSSNSTGCHHLRLSKAKCNANPSLHLSVSDCGVFTADQKPCFVETNQANVTYADETFSSRSRCFMSSLASGKNSQNTTPEEMSARCYESKCEANAVYVRVQNGEWILCHPGSKVQVNNFIGSVECPPALEICSSFHVPDLPLSSPSVSLVHPVYNGDFSEDSSHVRPVRSGEVALPEEEDKQEEEKRLYVDLKVSTGSGSNGDGKINSAVYSILKKHRLLFYSQTTSHFGLSARFCLIVGVQAGDTMDFRMLKKILKKELSSLSIRYNSVDVLTSHCYFCRRYRSYSSANRRREKLPAGCGGASSDKKAVGVMVTVGVAGLVWIAMMRQPV